MAREVGGLMRGFGRIGFIISCAIIISTMGCDFIVQSGVESQTTPSIAGPSSITERNDLGEEIIRTTTTATVRNCGGGITSTTVIYSSAVENAVEWTVGVQSGVGATIGGNYVPGGLDLSVVLSGAIAPQLRATNEQSVAHTLQGPPNVVMEYEIQWDISWRKTSLVVTTPLGTNQNVLVRYVANISSQIIGERSFSCDGSRIVPTTQMATVATIQQPAATSADLQPTQPSNASYYTYGFGWQSDDAARTMTWIGPTDGREDVWQPSGDPLNDIRAGYTAIFGPMDVPGEIFACVLTLNGQQVKNSCEGANVSVEAGKVYRVISSGPVGGFRWCPAPNMGHRVNNPDYNCR